MKLGIALDYSQPQFELPLDKVALAERLGYDSVWSAEAYGSDALTPLAYLAATTRHLRLGTGLIQLAARTPAATAMAAATLDQLAGGAHPAVPDPRAADPPDSRAAADTPDLRAAADPPDRAAPDPAATSRVIIGLGVSGPQIVEGWYGRPWGKPADMLRDYITIMRKILRREGPVTHDGRAMSLPYVGPGALGQGKPLKSILHPNPNISIWLGCGGPASVRLMAELCDGWLPMGLTPENWDSTYKPLVLEGLARAEATGTQDSSGAQDSSSAQNTPPKSLDDLEIQGGCHVELTDNLEATWAARKPAIGFLVGGYGSRSHNFHKQTMVRRGYGEQAEKVQQLFLDDKREQAFAAIPDEYIDEMGLYGDEARIRQRFDRFKGGPFTGLTIHTDELEILELMADIAGLTPRTA